MTFLSAMTAAQKMEFYAGIASASPSPLLKRWRRAMARAATGSTTVGRILCVGDSTTRTPYLASTLINGGAQAAYPDRLAKKLSLRGIKATTNAVYGMNGFTPSAMTAYDPRVVFGGAWTAGSNSTIGGAVFLNNSDTGTLAISMYDTFDTILVRYRGQTGSFTVDIGGAVLQTVTQTTTDDLQTATVATGAAAATGTINIKRVSGTIEILGVEAYVAAAPGIIVINGGRGAWASSNWVPGGQGWTAGIAVRRIVPDLLIDGNAGVNDVNTVTADPAVPNVPVATFIANKQASLTSWKADMDVLLMTLAPQDPGSFSTLANQETFRQAVVDLGVSNGLPVFDWNRRLVSRTDGNTYGFYGDARHPSPLGHDDQATALLNILVTQ